MGYTVRAAIRLAVADALILEQDEGAIGDCSGSLLQPVRDRVG
jgi:hypothetical protein